MNILKLVVSIIICHLAGIIGSLFTAPAIDSWYQFLEKPIFNPPSWVFAPAWLVLYTLMGISLYLIWKTEDKWKLKRIAIIFFATQLILNGLWSIIFFGAKNPMWAFFEILLLWIFIGLTFSFFYMIKRKSAYLLLPYWLWVSFAALLNVCIWYLN